jgi:hypothetical protein
MIHLQITRKIKRVLQKSVVEHTVAERKKWPKFGKERGNKEGPDRATTTVGENVALKMTAGNKVRFQNFLLVLMPLTTWHLDNRSRAIGRTKYQDRAC